MSDDLEIKPERATCAACGDCCKVIFLMPNVAKLVRSVPLLEAVGDAAHILRHWHEITQDQAVQMYPDIMKVASKDAVFFTCDLYDTTNHVCTIHGPNKPHVCASFPWYDGGPDAVRLLPFPRCSYWWDVPQDQWPENVQPMECELK